MADENNNQNQQQYNMPPQYNQQQYAQPPQKPKKPIYKKWWFWLIIVFVLIIIISAVSGGGSDSDSSSDASSNTTVSEEITEEETETTTETTTVTTTEETTVSKKKYKEQCKKINYKDLARNPDNYKGEKVKFTGEVIQVIESSWDNSVEYRIAVSKEDWGYSSDEVVYVTYEMSENESRILEDDIVTFYGEADGLCTYESTMGAQISIPQVNAVVIELKE
ncbi:MAG: hypothetical protein ACI4IE_09135 [Eubacterium sp.]